jgi:site-specific DNA-methyltransferase (adenine-specific)
VLLKKPSQNATRKVYDFVPKQDFSSKWSDEKLNKKYKLEPEDIEFIDKMIRPMDLKID